MQNHITVVVSHFVKPGKEQEFERALTEVIQKAKAYTGYEGIQIVPIPNHVEIEYMLLIRFDTEENYENWAHSETRRKWAEELNNYIVKESRIRYQDGLEFWFSVPQVTPAKPAPKWKMALLTWIVIYPLVLGFGSAAGAAFPSVPSSLRLLFVSAILVAMMTYFIMPRVTTLFAPWLYK